MFRIMIVDDEHMIHLSLRKLVESSALDIAVSAEAEDGSEALGLLESHVPDIIVTDIRMPEMDGLAFIEAARRKHRGIEFIILSGYNNFEYARQAMKFGVSEFLLKPVDPDQFLQAAGQICEKLKKNENRLSRQNEWFTGLQSMVRELAERIWETKEKEALEMAGQVVNSFAATGPEEWTPQQFAQNVMGLIDKELRQRHYIQSSNDGDALQWPGRPEGCPRLTSAAVSRKK